MTTAAGIWAWHNQFSSLPLAKCVERAQRAKIEGVIVKYGMPNVEQAYKVGGIKWATEVYAYISQPQLEGGRLADAVDAGAAFAVINAEEGPGGWGPSETTRLAMSILINTFRNRHPTVPLYASIDTRGDRLNHPYQQIMLQACDGIMPMQYPGSFYPSQPANYIDAAVSNCLAGKDFRGKLVFPTLQSYSWEWPKDSGQIHSIGPSGIQRQVALLQPYGAEIQGFQFYTIHHATDAEWDAVCRVVAAWGNPVPSPVDEAKMRKAFMDMGAELMHFQPDSLQRVVDTAAAYFGTRPTL
jgi:hypothetical protein